MRGSMSKVTAHEILADLARVRAELGRTPNRIEYGAKGNFSGVLVTATFGSYALMIKLSGLQYSTKGRRDKQEIRKEVFAATLKEAADRKPVAQPPKIYNHILVWSDRHKPYHHPDTNTFLISLNRKYKFDLVIDIGDGEDFHGMSFHDTDVDTLSSGHELRAAIDSNKELYAEFPIVMACESNHSSMVYRKGKHHGFPRHVLKSYRDVLEAPEEWTWHHEIVVQMSNGKKCLFAHGYSSNVLQASQKRGMSCVQGHYHSKMGIQYWQNADGLHFAAQTGCMIDDAAYAFAYNKLGLDRPILGCLRIESGVPHILPMFLDSKGRWIGIIP